MKEAEFEALRERRGDYAANALEYLDFEEVERYEVLSDTPELILLYGRSERADCMDVRWAAASASALLQALKRLPGDTIVSFVPDAWMAEMKAAGCTEYGILREYWIEDIDALPYDIPECGCTPLTECEYARASEITFACRFQSREFTGETPAWVAAWMDGKDEEGGSMELLDPTILTCREGETPVGILCTGVYAVGHPKGAVVWVRELAVPPACQNRGIGRKLLYDTLRYGKARGAKRAFLMADDCNAGAIALYQKVGFQPNLAEAQYDLIYHGKQ